MTATHPFALTLAELRQAQSVVHAAMPPTPQYAWPLLRERLGTEVWLKHENHTPLGAFKVRGGLAYVDALLRQGARPPGLISATRGNHGQSIAFAAARHGLPVSIVVPEGNSPEKNAAMRALGAEVLVQGHDFQAAREAAAQLADQRAWVLVPSLHPMLVAGVASAALEFLEAAPPLDVVYVPIGMGSGACAMVAARNALGLKTEVVGVVLDAAPAYAQSLALGRCVAHAVGPTLADGMACRSPDETALAWLAQGLARVVRVSEPELATAMRDLYQATHQVAEGAGAAGWAAAMQERHRLQGLRVGTVLSGANVDADVFARVLAPIVHTPPEPAFERFMARSVSHPSFNPESLAYDDAAFFAI